MKTVRRFLSSPSATVWLIVLVAFFLRLYRIDNPIADWHAFRQADTASVTHEYVKHGVDLLRPRYHDLSNIQSGQDNSKGYRMVEFPIINGGIAFLLRAVPPLPLVATSRVVSVLASLGTLVFLVRFVERVTKNRTVALLSGWFFALLPYSIYYSRTVLPEPFMLFLSMASLSLFADSLTEKNPFKSAHWWLSAGSLSLALLLKPFVVFLAPIYLALLWPHRAKRSLYSAWWLIFAALAVGPLIWWRHWIEQFPSGIPASDWLLNGNGIRFRPAWFRWIFWERFSGLILGYAGVLLSVGALLWKRQGREILWAWWAGLLAFTAVFATGNVQHDYYQVIFTPVMSFALGLGTYTLWNWKQHWLSKTALVALVAITLCASWHQVSGYFNVNHWEYVEAGGTVDRLIPADAKIIAPAFGDTQFLFQTNRTGWPIGFEIESKINQGATHYVTTSYDDEARELEERFVTLTKNDRFLLLDLTQPRKETQP